MSCASKKMSWAPNVWNRFQPNPCTTKRWNDKKKGRISKQRSYFRNTSLTLRFKVWTSLCGSLKYTFTTFLRICILKRFSEPFLPKSQSTHTFVIDSLKVGTLTVSLHALSLKNIILKTFSTGMTPTNFYYTYGEMARLSAQYTYFFVHTSFD